MTKEELGIFISDIAGETLKSNTELIKEAFTEEFKDSDSYAEILAKYLSSTIRLSVVLSTSTTLSVLNRLGVLNFDALESK